MMNRKAFLPALSLLFLAPVLASVPAHAEPVVYKVDPDHSGVMFSIRHFVSNVPGRFNDFEGTIRYDKLVLSPGVELMWDSIEGLRAAHDDGRILQAWKAGVETLGITPRELDILEALAAGLSNKEIAERLFVSENTVKTHAARLFSKLDAGVAGSGATISPDSGSRQDFHKPVTYTVTGADGAKRVWTVEAVVMKSPVIDGLYAASAGCHPAGSVIGAAGHNAAREAMTDLGVA